MENNKSQEKDFYFSIVMAVYNVEEYIEEAIDSVINQTLDFKKHVQLILVNDGSPDGSSKICETYKNKYPDNIVYINKKNGGVSSARNAGIDAAKGKYVNFLDPDDKLSSNTLKNVYEFFKNKGSGIDLVSIPVYWFDQLEGPHILNHKHTSNRIVNVLKEHTSIQMSASSSFVRNESIKDLRFSEILKYGEDAQWVNKLILKKCEYGIVKNATYFYRKRKTKTSATNHMLDDKGYYLHTLLNFSFDLVDTAKNTLGFVPKYIQYIVMYDLQWRLNNNSLKSKLTEEETNEYFDKIKELLTFISDDIILEQKNLNLARKNFLLQLKYKNNHGSDAYHYHFSANNATMLVNDIRLDSMNGHNLTIEIIEIKNNHLIINGNFISLFDPDKMELIASFGGNKIKANKVDRFYKNINVFGKCINKAMGFQFSIPLMQVKEKAEISFFASINESFVPIGFKFSANAVMKNEENATYSKSGFLLISKKNAKRIIVKKTNTKQILKEEFKLYKKLYKNKGYDKVMLGRLYYRFKEVVTKKPIWLFMDRVNKADDNAEALFEYAVKQNDGIEKYFVIDKNCEDYNRLKKIGNVIPFGSRKHKMYMLLANKFISSHADEFIFNPFNKRKTFYKDLLDFEFIFLQHGIIKDDLSNWLNKFNKNAKLFVTSSEKEYDSILNGNYNYNENEIILSGLPRYDKLENQNEKRILIMPTWRSDIISKLDSSGKRAYNPSFKESSYFKHFNALLNNKKLMNIAKEMGYKIVFYPHPNVVQQLKDFQIDSSIEVAGLDSSYRDNFNKSDILITDYSSVAFDFAYLKKPIVYFQFENSFHAHLQEGYFDFKTMGFGDVFSKSDDVANRIIDYMENGCKMEDMYQERVNDFYAYNDKNNCKRVYEAIIKMDQ